MPSYVVLNRASWPNHTRIQCEGVSIDMLRGMNGKERTDIKTILSDARQ